MTKPNWIQALYATSLVVAALVPAGAYAELVKTQTVVKEAAIVPEVSEESEVEIEIERKVKSKPKKVVRVTREETEITPAVQEVQLPAEAVTPPPATKPSMGNQLDEGIKTKMVDVQNQFEQALLKTLDRIKITVDDGTTAQGASAPTQNVIVQDNLVGTNAAANKADYMSVDAAPVVAEDEDLGEGEEVSAGVTTAALEKKSERKVKIAPLFGRTTIGSSAYNISPRYTAGFELEFDVDKSFAMVLGYSYSQYDIALATGNPFYGYYQPQPGYGQNQQSLEYNQNVFSGGMRVYLMPPESKFRIFGGAGVGYNVGYLNYRQNQNQLGYQYYNQYYGQAGGDYEVKSWLGLLEAGALMSISESVSLGALFKYALVFSSSENQPLNNYAFNPGFGYGQPNDKQMVGGSLARDNFYSILGTVKVAF
jgi:hypothetical protein